VENVLCGRGYKQPWRYQPRLPASPPPGPVDIATWRLLWRVFAIVPRYVEMMAGRYGLLGVPLPRRAISETYGITPSRIGQLTGEIEQAAAQVGPPASLRPMIERLSTADRSQEPEVITELVDRGVLAEPLGIDSMVELARLYGEAVTVPRRVGAASGSGGVSAKVGWAGATTAPSRSEPEQPDA